MFMCGIIGYVGMRPAGEIAFKGLQRLEYRGYDSAGVACLHEGKIEVRKDVGKVGEINEKHHLSEMKGSIAIGHSRWASHGGVTRENSHPHSSCDSSIAVVHNGIIENYSELREELKGKGHSFTSQTDTEVIPHLIEEEAKTSKYFEEAVRRASKKLAGSFAILAISSKEPEKIIAVRKESPLVIGLGEGEVFTASDAMPFLEFTNKALFMEDDEMAIVTKGKVELYDLDGRKVVRTHTAIEWSAESVDKQGFEHYMLKEILEQPRTIKNALVQDKNVLEEIAREIMISKDVKIVACGTSRHAGLIGRSLFSKLSRKSCEVYIASEFAYFASSCSKETLIIAISQSGETADVLTGLKKAKTEGARIISLVNVVGSSIARMSDKVLYLNAGPEIAVASTKAFTSQLTLLYLIAFAMAGRLEEGIRELKEVSKKASECIELNQGKAMEIARQFKQKEHIYYLARGVNFPVALEGALKLKEVSYIHAEGMPAGELKHGTLALVERDTPVIVINPIDYTFNDTISNALETKARGAKIIGVSNEPNQIYDELFKLPETNELFYPLLSILPLQLLAYYSAKERGCNVDFCRNLAKSVTIR